MCSQQKAWQDSVFGSPGAFPQASGYLLASRFTCGSRSMVDMVFSSFLLQIKNPRTPLPLKIHVVSIKETLEFTLIAPLTSTNIVSSLKQPISSDDVVWPPFLWLGLSRLLEAEVLTDKPPRPEWAKSPCEAENLEAGPTSFPNPSCPTHSLLLYIAYCKRFAFLSTLSTHTQKHTHTAY